MKKQIEERFIYSWVISCILGIAIAALFIWLYLFAFQQLQQFNGKTGPEIGMWGIILTILYFCLCFIGFAGALFFLLGLFLGTGVTTQMILCEYGLWPEPKRLRTGSFMDSGMDFE